jgi:hypothetical protein
MQLNPFAVAIRFGLRSIKHIFFALNQYDVVLINNAGGMQNYGQWNGESGLVWEIELDPFLEMENVWGGGVDSKFPAKTHEKRDFSVSCTNDFTIKTYKKCYGDMNIFC